MGRKCSHCGNIGHNSRTCNNYKLSCKKTNVVNGLRLFGVQLDIHSSSSSSSSYTYSSNSIGLKKSFSMDCLPCSSPATSSSPFSSLSSSRVSISEESGKVSVGYLSDGLSGHLAEKKKGIPWSEEEHKAFLAGLEKQGRGDWRGISRKFVTTRTPTQVASHAQKYFLRQASLNNKKRRSSLFDMVSTDKMGDHDVNYSNTKITSSSYIEENHQNHNYSQSSSPNEAPDLELTLGDSRPADQDKSPSNSLLIGPITVV